MVTRDQTGRVVRFEGPRQATIATYDEPELGPGEVRLRTLYSGISAGTELTAYRGSNPYLTKNWNEDDAPLRADADRPSFSYPIDGWGYEEVGEVAEVGADVTGVAVGDVIYGTWGHRSTTSCTAAWAAERRAARRRSTRSPASSPRSARSPSTPSSTPTSTSARTSPSSARASPACCAASSPRAQRRRRDRRRRRSPRRLELARQLGARHAHRLHAEPARRSGSSSSPTDAAPTSRSRSPASPARSTTRSAPPPTTRASSPRASSRAAATRSCSARSSTTTASRCAARRSPASARARPPLGPAAGSNAPSCACAPRAASTGRPDLAHASRSPTPARRSSCCTSARPRPSRSCWLHGGRLRDAQEHLLPGDTLEQKWEAAQELGFHGIELHRQGDLAFEARLPSCRRPPRAGVAMQTVCVNSDHFIGDFDADGAATPSPT